MTDAEKLIFELCIKNNILSDRSEGTNIGTYKEKRLHQILKMFLEPDEALHEIAVGEYIADICRDNEIIEIQTGSFYPMKEKLAYYLDETELAVTVVRPIPYIKWCVWLDADSGEIVSRKRSNKKTLPKDIMRDWFYLCDFIGHERLKIKFLLLEEEEYRFLCGWSRDKKRGSRRYERIPLGIIDEKVYSSKEDYLEFLPEGLPNEFAASDYMKLMKLSSYGAYSALKILAHLGFLEKSKEKKGRSYTYKPAKP